MALDLRLSRVRTGVAAMRQDCNYQLDIRKLGRKKAFLKKKGFVLNLPNKKKELGEEMVE